MIAQAIKRYTKRRVVGVARRIARGAEAAEVGARLRHTPKASPHRGHHQHRLHRATSGHLPLPARSPGAQNAGGGASEGDARGGHVVGVGSVSTTTSAEGIALCAYGGAARPGNDDGWVERTPAPRPRGLPITAGRSMSC